jgi:hypothetical protein
MMYCTPKVRHGGRWEIELAWLIDIAEQREAFQHQVSGTHLRLEAVMENILRLPDAPQVKDKNVASADLLAIVRSLVDAAGDEIFRVPTH